jgi:hypothetical protein
MDEFFFLMWPEYSLLLMVWSSQVHCSPLTSSHVSNITKRDLKDYFHCVFNTLYPYIFFILSLVYNRDILDILDMDHFFWGGGGG